MVKSERDGEIRGHYIVMEHRKLFGLKVLVLTESHRQWEPTRGSLLSFGDALFGHLK